MDSAQNPSRTKRFVAGLRPLEASAGQVHRHQLKVLDFRGLRLMFDAPSPRKASPSITLMLISAADASIGARAVETEA